MFRWGTWKHMIGCTKFNEWCTKFCEGCTKGSKVRSEVGIDLQSLSYGFLNEIMDHRCSNGSPGSDRIGCTKFNEWCTKFCEGCTKGSKVRFEVGISPQSLSYGFLNENMDHPCSDGGPVSDRIGCTKFNKRCTKFCKWCTKGPWFHFRTHEEVIGGQSPLWNALWNHWYILHKIWYIIH